MRNRLLPSALLVLGGFAICQSVPVLAQETCVSATGDPVPAAVREAIAAWESLRGYQLEPASRELVMQTYCSAAAQLVEEYGIERSSISAAAKESVHEYLDAILTTDQNATGLADRLVSRFVLGSGPALPEPRRMGVLRITYQQNVDRLQVSGRRMNPATLLLAEIGARRVEGFRDSHRVCSGEVTITRIPQAFTC